MEEVAGAHSSTVCTAKFGSQATGRIYGGGVAVSALRANRPSYPAAQHPQAPAPFAGEAPRWGTMPHWDSLALFLGAGTAGLPVGSVRRSSGA